MKLCPKCNNFTINCDFCKYVKYEDGFMFGPTGCALHEDEDHQKKAQNCGVCEDYYCKNADKEDQ